MPVSCCFYQLAVSNFTCTDKGWRTPENALVQNATNEIMDSQLEVLEEQTMLMKTDCVPPISESSAKPIMRCSHEAVATEGTGMAGFTLMHLYTKQANRLPPASLFNLIGYISYATVSCISIFGCRIFVPRGIYGYF